MHSFIVTGPTTLPVSTADAKLHLRVDHSTDDTLIENLVSAATDYVQASLGQQLVTATRRMRMDCWPKENYFEIDYPPLVSLSGTGLGITYVDANGDTQTWSSSEYDVHTDYKPGRVYLGYDYTWPTIRGMPNAITVTYTCGYGDAASVPETIITAILMLVAGWYEHRLPQGESSRAVDALMSSASHGRYP